jgi:hypothetical protein
VAERSEHSKPDVVLGGRGRMSGKTSSVNSGIKVELNKENGMIVVQGLTQL